jgi:hypothetical protein
MHEPGGRGFIPVQAAKKHFYSQRVLYSPFLSLPRAFLYAQIIYSIGVAREDRRGHPPGLALGQEFRE